MEVRAAHSARVGVEKDIEEIIGIGKIGVPVSAEHHPMSRLLQRAPRLGRGMPRDIDLDADRREVLDQQRQQSRVVEFIGVPSSILDAKSGRITTVAYERTRAFNVVLESAQAWLVAQEAGREEGVGDDAEPAEDFLID